jgi:single-strand DNA-binding protein
VSRELRLPSLNRVVIAGNLTRDPEIRYTQSGAAVANIGLASSRYYKDPKDPAGEWKEDTCFVTVVAWAQLAERVGDTLKKGSPVLVEGRLQSRSWETEDGQKRNVIEIRADSIQNLERRGGGGGAPAYAGAPAQEEGAGADDSMKSDDLPF